MTIACLKELLFSVLVYVLILSSFSSFTLEVILIFGVLIWVEHVTISI